jgi:hypothetical protein
MLTQTLRHKDSSEVPFFRVGTLPKCSEMSRQKFCAKFRLNTLRLNGTAELQYEYYIKGTGRSFNGDRKAGTHQIGLAMNLIPYINNSNTREKFDAFKTINIIVTNE